MTPLLILQWLTLGAAGTVPFAAVKRPVCPGNVTHSKVCKHLRPLCLCHLQKENAFISTLMNTSIITWHPFRSIMLYRSESTHSIILFCCNRGDEGFQAGERLDRHVLKAPFVSMEQNTRAKVDPWSEIEFCTIQQPLKHWSVRTHSLLWFFK